MYQALFTVIFMKDSSYNKVIRENLFSFQCYK